MHERSERDSLFDSNNDSLRKQQQPQRVSNAECMVELAYDVARVFRAWRSREIELGMTPALITV
jgi:hypothetical protein